MNRTISKLVNTLMDIMATELKLWYQVASIHTTFSGDAPLINYPTSNTLTDSNATWAKSLHEQEQFIKQFNGTFIPVKSTWSDYAKYKTLLQDKLDELKSITPVALSNPPDKRHSGLPDAETFNDILNLTYRIKMLNTNTTLILRYISLCEATNLRKLI